ncbi:uncharacterized protein BDZ99DRAFT_345753, partial [Mytilinidion resinicola]
MRVSLFLALSYLSAAVWAGGYQGCLERVWLFQAYEIDALNPEMDQTLGFRCSRWNDGTKQCDGDWNPCRSRAGTRCNFDELTHFMGNAPTPRGWQVLDPATRRLDTQRTAENCYRIFTTRGRGRVPNFPPYSAMKNTYEYNDYLIKLTKKVNDVWMKKSTVANKQLWEDFDSTREKISVARAGDHGPYLLNAARASLGGTMTIHTQNLGNNPATGAVWETVDWKETASQARTSGIADAQTRIRDFLDSWY